VYNYTAPPLRLFFTLPSIAIYLICKGTDKKSNKRGSTYGVSFLMFVERSYISFLNRDGKNVNVLTYYI